MNGEISVEREIFIAASPETVFRFFVEPALMALWFGQRHTLDPRPGGIFRVEVGAGNIAHGTYTEVTPHRRIAFTWGWEVAAICRLAAHWSKLSSCPKTAAPCSGFDIAAFHKPWRRRSHQRTTGSDGRTT